MATLNISLTPELASLISDKVSSGMYHSASEVVREGLRLLKEQDDIRRVRLNELKRQVQNGVVQIENGDVKVYYSGEELADHIEAEGRRILAKRNSAT
jgi:antitoxin ParD1/3/4